MNSPSMPNRGIIKKFFSHLHWHGPLGTMRRTTTAMRDHLNNVPGCESLFHSIESLLRNVQHYLDASFDRKYGVKTAGRNYLPDLTTASNNYKECFWYEPMSAKIFRQIMRQLHIPFDQFEFIDFGSGKGRVLFLASEYGFKKITGVEFAQELHHIAGENIAIWRSNNAQSQNIFENICTDATNFPIPKSPLVIFFNSLFKGTVMDRVINNVLTSYAMNPREIALIFYGPYNKSKKPLDQPEFQVRELKLRADWSVFVKYRCFLFTSHELTLMPLTHH